MGVSDFTSSFGFGAFDMSAILNKIYFFAGIFLFALIVGGLVIAFFVLKKREKGKEEKAKIGWWEEINGRMEPTHMDKVEELIIPGTTLRIFYSKEKNLYLPRFTRGISKKLYYVLMTPTRQMVNFTLQSLTENLKQAKLDYDHTDMLWAAENSREYIKRNYKDKAVKWWVAYQGVITTAAYIILLTFSMVLIIYFLRGIIEDIGEVAAQLTEALKQSCSNQGSGIVAG